MDTKTPLYQRGDKILAAVIAGFALLVYLATMTPSLSYQSPDGNELATIPYVLGLAHSPGYPIYTWMGKLFTLLPFGDVAFRVNLMSGVCAALAAGGLYLILIGLLSPLTSSASVRRWSAALSSMALAFSPTYWSQAVIAEVYAPNLSLVVITLLALLNWDRKRSDGAFFLFCLSYGLSLGGHLSNLGFAPAFGLFVLITQPGALKRPRFWIAGLGGFLLGAAQFLWLPLRASTLLDPGMLERAPDSLADLYRYTLGAFPNFKFAFPLQDLPDRLVLYLLVLLQQFGLMGILLAVIGLWSLLLRRWRIFYLLFGIYLIQVWFFIQYSAFDLEVFFLIAHLIWAIFLGFGWMEVLAGLAAITERIKLKPLQVGLRWVGMAMGVILLVSPMLRHWKESDRSHDTAINDFYAAVWEILPPESTLLTRGGVFGYDAFYWKLVYGTRTDVTLPLLEAGTGAGRLDPENPLYSTTDLPNSWAPDRQRLESALLPLAGEELWATPILLGESGDSSGLARLRPLFLVELSTEPPTLVMNEIEPNLALEAGPLVGADLPAEPIESGGWFTITTYWRINGPTALRIVTFLDDQPLETHQLGMGNLERYDREVQSVADGFVVETVNLILPSDTPPGEHQFQIQIGAQGQPIPIGTIEVMDEEGRLERWLRIAGK